MEEEVFQKQVERLRANYGERAYLEERTTLFWKALKATSDHIFVAAVDELIANARAAPMLKELSKAIDEARAADAAERADWARTDASRRGREGLLGVLEDAVEKSEAARQYGSECVALLKQKLSGAIPRDDFYATVEMLGTVVPNVKCRLCRDQGVLVTDGVRRCKCLAGQRISERAFAATRTDGAREYVTIPSI